jgi:site-specific DNA recombinase
MSIKKQFLGIYCRVSTSEQAEYGVSLEDQEKRGVELANKLGWDFEVFIDGGVSGGLLPAERPEFSRLLSKCLKGQISGIFTTDFKRLSREADDGLISLFKSRDIKLFDLKGEVDLKDPNVELLVRIMKDVAHYERIANKAAIERALERNVINGKVSGGPIVNYGYTKDEKKMLVIDEKEATIVRLIYRLAVEGNGTKRISTILNEKKIPTKRGNITTGKKMKVRGIDKTEFVWRDAVIYRILTNPIYKGIRVYKDVELPYNPKLEIINSITFDLVRELLNKRDQFKNTTNKYEFLLKGLIKCPNCGGIYYGHKRQNGKDNAYTCNSNRYGKNCGNRGIGIDFLDNMIWEDIGRFDKIIIQVVSKKSLKIIDKQNKESLTEVQNQMKELKLKLDNLLDILELDKNNQQARERYEKRQNELLELQREEKITLREIEIGNEKEKLIEFSKKVVQAHSAVKSFTEKRDLIRSIVDFIEVGWLKDYSVYVLNINYKLNTLENIIISNQTTLDRNSRIEGKALTKILDNVISLQNSFLLDDKKDEIDNGTKNGIPHLTYDVPRQFL